MSGTMPVDNPADGGQNVHIVGGTVAMAAPAPGARTVLLASTVLGAGGSQAAPAFSAGTPVTIPAGATKALVWVSYTRSTGQAAAQPCVMGLLGNGTESGSQTSDSLGGYQAYGTLGPVPPSDSLIKFCVGPFDLGGGPTTFNAQIAEYGVVGSPGTAVLAVTFQ